MVDELRQIIPDEIDELAEPTFRRRRPAADVLPLPEEEGPSFTQVMEAEEEVAEARGLAQDLESLQRLDPSFADGEILRLRDAGRVGDENGPPIVHGRLAT